MDATGNFYGAKRDTLAMALNQTKNGLYGIVSL